MAANYTSRCFHRFGHFTLFTLFILAVSLSNVYSADVNGDLVFDDVTSNPSSQFRPLNWRKHVNKNVNHIVTEEVPDKNDESSYFSPIRFVGTLKGSFERVKRGLFDWGFGSLDDKTDSETKTTIQSTVNSNEASSSTLTSSKETTEEQTESLLIGNTLTTLIREARSTNSDSNDFPLGDDEDMDENSGTPSGDTKFPGGASFPGTNFDHPSHPYLFRIILTIKEPFINEFEDRNSKNYQELSQSLSSAIEDLYQDLPGRKMARLVGIQKKADDYFESIVMIDLEFIGYYDADEIQERLKRHISEYSKLGNIPVSDKDIKIKDFGAGKKCLPGEIDCNTENGPSCLPAEARCNGIPECTDGIDESNCPRVTPELTTDFKSPDVNTSDHVYVPFETSTVGTTASGRGTKLCRSDEQVRCADGVTLICDVQKCDDHVDCPQGDDEENCPKSSVCASTEFVCDITRCIPQTSVCDQKRDCTDDTDEHEDCEYNKACTKAQWQCNDGTCISDTLRCNGLVDCPTDASDELNCQRSYCTTDQFQCNDGTCVAKDSLCDRHYHCPDGSDEFGCAFPQTCGPRDFTCADGQCIDNYKRCNRIPDCRDRSDEDNCPCYDDEFRCRDGSCIPEANRCNGRSYDCRDNSDEENCYRACSSDEFRCHSGECISSSKVCDYTPDCRDRSDELNCTQQRTCSWTQFACHSRTQCVPKHKHCDGTYDCSDRSDEFNCAPNPIEELHLKTYPEDQLIKEGREVVFQCRDEGPLRAAVRWSRGNGLPLPPGSRDQSGRLEMPNIQLSHAGTYVCEALSFSSSSPSARVSVHLSVEPYTQPLPPTRPPLACGLNEATCSNGECISKSLVCNGHYDCTDGSDEMRCNPHGCEPNQFTCDNRRCVQKTWRCDSDDDCGDGSDERNCGTSPPGARCRTNEFECSSLNQCIPKAFHCDMEPDCQDGSDEISCSRVFPKVPPEPMKVLNQGETFFMSCEMTGVPTPEIIWRRNWGHIPPKCVVTSENGYGTITCPDVQDSDQGAYSCEGMNSRGSTLATPDTILVVSPPNGTSVCPPGQFNDLARIPSECITCFCFGTTSECRSANLFTYQLPAPADRFQLVDVYLPTNGPIVVRRNEPSSLQPALRARSRSFQLLSETSASRTYEELYPYFSLPENNYHGNHLKSYGGFLNYTVSFSGIGQPLNHPDVILVGNGQTLIHKGPRLAINRDNQRSVQFFVGDWYRVQSDISGGEDAVTPPRRETLATRGDIMMALEDVENILINVQYLTGPGIETSISNVHVDSAAVPNSGQGQAALVEQCSCPAGYMGLSCEECSPGFVRESSGSWLGRCTKHEECNPGYYGDPGRGIPCKPCPCPLTNPSNQFGRTCYLGTDGDVVCNCPEGYTDRRCSTCDEGYTGNPLIPGDYCKKNLCNAVGSISTLPDPSTGQCRCKEHVTGPFCDTCKENTFHLSTRYHKGCVSCFCMGITKECRSLNWYRNQITAAFTRTTQDFKLAEISDLSEPITDGLFVQPQTRELVYEQFNRPDVYYWVLPHKFLGDRIDSYGGYLNYTLRYVPTPGGQSSRNNAPDVELISNNNIRLRYFNNDNPIEPNRPATISVPMVESKWQREDGQTADRENFLMALADLNAILIKATYTTNTQSAALITVSLDYADERNTFQTRTTEVEQCTCPPGYRGLSCQECDIGYTRTDTGLYLGICEPCNCNGHASICDPNTGKCTNCEGHTTGDSCELCESGYVGNPGRGEPCTVDGGDNKSLCYCDERGSFSTECRNNQCSCKTNVEGPRCDRCRSGCFDLSASHPEGCLECFCSSVTDVCQPSNLYLTQIPMQIIDQSHGFTLTDSNRNEVIRDEFHLNVAQNEIGYDFRNQHSRRLFWSLPPNFTGDKVTSYGGNLTFTQLYSSLQGVSHAQDTDVVIVGNGISIYWTSEEELQPDRPTTRVIPLVASKWRRLDLLSGQRTASRVDILTVLSAVEAILIRATFGTHTSSTFLSDVSLDTAVPQRTGQAVATHVELCRCPPGYRGTSCELCSPGYYRDTNHRCHQCPCNGNEESCALGSDSRVVCHCKPSFIGPYCDSLGSVTTDGPSTSSPIAPPSISISISDPTATIVGRTVRVRCSARALIPGRSVSLTWSKDKGELPRGRAEDDGQGNLAISDVNLSDSGYYICTANDGYSYVTERVLVLVKDHSVALPQVSVHPKSQEVTEGESVRFECNAKGIPTPTLQWVDVQRNQLNPQSSFVDGVFYIPSVRSTDQSTYQCIATNSEGTRAETVVLYVRELSTASPIGNNLTVEPQEAIGSPGEIIRIRCSPPSPDYVVSWSRTSNQPLQPTATNEDGILTIYDASPSDSGLYICSAKTSSGYHLDGYGRITVQSYRLPPSVRIEPESQTVMQGMVAELRCAATGEPAPIVRWSKLQENLPDNIQVTGNILKILNARVADRGVYICQAENAGGNAQGAAKVEVEPREAPQVELYPHSLQTVTEGNSVMFQCIIKAGIPNPTLHWAKANDLALPQNAELLNGGVLRLTSVSVADKGQYICSVENDVGKASAIATIEVYTLPRIQVTPRGPIITVTPGQKLRLDCRAVGYPEPSVSWEKYQPSSNIFGFDPVQSPSSRTGAVFEIFSATENDEGIYICKANNAAGPAEEHIQVVLSNALDPGPTRGDIPGGADYDEGNHPQPVGHLEIDNTLFRIPAGGNGQIQCRVTANSNVLQLKWERNGNSTLPSDFYHRDGILYINNVQRHDAGVYSCLGISHSGSILFTADARVQVVEIPRITLDPVKQTVRLGDNAQVICHVHGDPPIEVSWAAVNRALPPSATARDGYLTFHNIAESDAGKYICRARNSYGNVEAVAEVIINEHVHNNYRPVITASDRSPVAIEGSSISLKCNSEPHIRIYWTRDRYPLPSNARSSGNDLKLDSLRQEDSGRYICHAESASGITSSDYIDLRVSQPQLCSPSEFHCRSGECIPLVAVCDQRLHCRDGSDESYCNHRPLRGANNVTLRIEPSQDVVRIGDNVELRCVSYGAPTQVYWSKVGDVQTTNIQVPSSDVVRIVGAELNNRGLYRCSSQTPTGVVDEDYILNIQPSLPHVDAATVETKTAANGQSVIMDCNVKMPPPVKYVWSKQEGELPARASVNQGTLSIPEVTAAEAGMYICTATNDDGRMDIPTILVVTGSVPFFSQAPVSYIAVPTLHNAYLDFDIELSFKPEQPDGLILYNSQQNDGSGDFVSLGLKNGVLEFRFDVGSGIAVIRASHPISVGQWHTVQLHRDRREGKMYVDGSGPFSGYSSGNFQGLDLLEPMFLGGFPDFSHIHKLAGFSSGFVGCISKLVVGKREIDLIKDAVRREGITHCETCAVNPCDNNGVCQESPTQQGYRCICPRGFSGENCTQVGEPCFPGVCGTGRCSSSERGMDCYCPIYKGGKRCERSISEYAFSGNAYLAYPTPKAVHKLKVALKFNPASTADSILLYCAQNEYGQGDFTSLSIKDQYIEFRFDTGTGPTILRSKQQIYPGQWVTVSAVRDHREGSHHVLSKLIVNGHQPVIENASGKSHGSNLNLRTPLYIGGYDKFVKLASGVGVKDSFKGCISEVEVSGLESDYIRSVVETFNVEECSELHKDACQLQPCQNDGNCVPSSNPPRYSCICKVGFSGEHCEIEDDMCKLLNPCRNSAKCTGTSSSYKCLCPIGYSGATCGDRVEFNTEVSFQGDGFIELSKDMLPHTNPEEEEIVTIEFSTENLNGILFWHGQNLDTDGVDQDYLSLAVAGGFLEMSWELGGGPAVIRSHGRVNDGRKHTVVMKRTAKDGSLKVDDDMNVFGETSGLLTHLNSNGNIYLGGLPNVEKMTGRKYSEGLNGCIHFIQIQDSGVINLWEKAVSAQNALPCSSTDHFSRYDDDENSIHPNRGDLIN